MVVRILAFSGTKCSSKRREACLIIIFFSHSACLYDPSASGVSTILTHTDGVGGVQFAAQRALAVEGPGHVAAHSVDARAGEALVDI